MAHRTYKKRDLPVHQVRRFLEPGPIVLVSSEHQGQRDIMSMGWHMMMEFEPSRIGCLISEANESFDLIRKSKQCVINLPEAHLLSTIIAIGNQHGGDKFAQFRLTAEKSATVRAPRIRECYAHFECQLEEYIAKYGLFVFEVKKALAAISPKYPKTVHYRGDGVFMLSGSNVKRAAQFRPENL